MGQAMMCLKDEDWKDMAGYGAIAAVLEERRTVLSVRL